MTGRYGRAILVHDVTRFKSMLKAYSTVHAYSRVGSKISGVPYDLLRCMKYATTNV